MIEVWKDIKDYEGLYQVSNKGRVFSFLSNKILKFGKNRGGYYYVNLSIDGNYISHSIHRLIGKAFIPNPDNLPEVNHLDGVKINNNVDNLEWVTRSNNQLHAYKIGLQPKRNGENNGNNKLSKQDVEVIREKYIPRKYSQRKLAKEYNVHFQTINLIINNKLWI